MKAKQVELSGRVVREIVNRGSKGEQDAVVLKTDQGESYILRRNDGPTFGDAHLGGLVGTSITTEGVALGKTMIMRAWSVRK